MWFPQNWLFMYVLSRVFAWFPLHVYNSEFSHLDRKMHIFSRRQSFVYDVTLINSAEVLKYESELRKSLRKIHRNSGWSQGEDNLETLTFIKGTKRVYKTRNLWIRNNPTCTCLIWLRNGGNRINFKGQRRSGDQVEIEFGSRFMWQFASRIECVFSTKV